MKEKREFDSTQENSPGPDTVRIDSTETDTEGRGDGACVGNMRHRTNTPRVLSSTLGRTVCGH